MKTFRLKAFLFFFMICLITISGCEKKSTPPASPIKSPVGIEDYQKAPLMETQQGFYYNVPNLDPSLEKTYELHYYDKKTKQDVILCNKPECRHDGNEFCVGTNNKYVPIAFQLYDGAIFMTAICDGENSHDFKLVRISLDGSSLTEIATFYSVNKIENNHPSKYVAEDACIIHRGKALLSLCIGGNEGLTDTISHGAFVYDINSNEITPLYEEPVSPANPPLENLDARGDFFYFVTMDEKKRILHQYSLESKSDERLELLNTFTGDYAVMKNGNVYYRRGTGTKLALRKADGKNEDLGYVIATVNAQIVKESISELLPLEWIDQNISAEMKVNGQLQTDGETLCIPSSSRYVDYGQMLTAHVPLDADVDPDDLRIFPGHYGLAYHDAATDKFFYQASYEQPDGQRSFVLYDDNGKKLSDLEVNVSAAEDLSTYGDTFYRGSICLSSDQFYYTVYSYKKERGEVIKTDQFSVMSLSDFLSGKAITSPLTIEIPSLVQE